VGEVKPIEFVRETDGIADAQKDKIVRSNAAELLSLPS
jgi:hypothetical protein